MVTRPVYRRTSQLHRATFLLFGPFYAMFHVEMLCLTINIFVQQIADIYPFTLLQFELFQYFSHFHMNLNRVETFISWACSKIFDVDPQEASWKLIISNVYVNHIEIEWTNLDVWKIQWKMSPMFIIRQLIFVKSWTCISLFMRLHCYKLSKLSALLTEWFDVWIDCICGVPRGSFTSLLFSLPAHCCCSKHWEALSKIHRIKSELELLQGFEFISRLGLLCLSHFLFLYLLNNLQSFWKSLFKLFSSVNCSFCSEVADSKIVKILMQLFNKLNLLNSW